MEDTIIGGIALLVAVFGICGGYLFGKIGDPIWKCKQMRKLLKKNYIVLFIVQKDGRTINSKIVNAENDIAQVGSKMWIIEKGRLYRQDKLEEGFKITTNVLRWSEGCPCLFVDSDSIHALSFEGQGSHVSPEEAGSTILAWNYNQLMKALATSKNFQLFLTIILVASIVGALLGFISFSKAGECADTGVLIQKQVQQIYEQTVPQEVNGTVVIEGKRG